MSVSTEQGREYAVAQLRQRRENKPEKKDNGSLPAGSPMYYYCKSCGWVADILPENWFVTGPRKLCLECQALQDLNWLE